MPVPSPAAQSTDPARWPPTLVAAQYGFGTIGAPIDFDGTAAIFAENGTLTINGTITDVGTIGTAGVTPGTLNIPTAWNSSVADFVNMNGGTLQGGAITVANLNGISGRGMVTSRVVNNTRLGAAPADRSFFRPQPTTTTGTAPATSAFSKQPMAAPSRFATTPRLRTADR